MYDRAQMNKGILEGCILKIISLKSTYGYDLLTILVEVGFSNMKESTLYPVLIRLEKKGYLNSFYEPSFIGPARKYYKITKNGKDYLNDFIIAWNETENVVNYVLRMEM